MKTIAATSVAVLALFAVVAIMLIARKTCIDYVAPWMLNTDDKVAAAIYCKVP